MLKRMKDWARKIKRDVHALWLSAWDPRTPWYGKVFAFLVAAYALSPIDLIPDFIPVLGYVDDLILVPVGILIAVRLVPLNVMTEHRATAAAASERPVNKGAAFFMVVLWIAASALIAWWLIRCMA